MWELFGKGIVAGIIYALLSMPFIGIIEKQTHERRWTAAMPLIYGIVIAEGIWSCIAALILYLLVLLTSTTPIGLGLIGAIYVFIMALRSYRNHVQVDLEQSSSVSNGLLLGLSFPSHLIGYAAIIATLGIPDPFRFASTFASPIGVMGGALLYWTAFAFSTQLLIHNKVTHRLRVTGAFVLALLALLAIIRIYL